jgi:hypothetical protein
VSAKSEHAQKPRIMRPPQNFGRTTLRLEFDKSPDIPSSTPGYLARNFGVSRRKKVFRKALRSFLLIFVIFIVLSLLSPFASAQEEPTGGLVPSSCQEGCPCNICDLYTLALNIINFMLYGIAIPVAAVGFLFGGFTLLTSGGSPERLKRGRSAITTSIMGIALAFSAWAIFNVILSTIGFGIGTAGTAWFDPPTCEGTVAGASCDPPGPTGGNTDDDGNGVGGSQPPPPPAPLTGQAAASAAVLADLQRASNNKLDANTFNCPPTCLDNISDQTFRGAVTLSQMMVNAGFLADGTVPLVITGGNENTGGHSGSGPGSHVGGDKLDFRSRANAPLTQYIDSLNLTPLGDTGRAKNAYRVPGLPDAIFVYEGGSKQHWDVCFRSCTEFD